MRRDRLRAWILIAALGGLGALALPRLRVETDITHFLPSSEDRQLAELARTLASSSLNRTVTLVLEAQTPDQAVRAGQTMAEILSQSDEVQWVRAGPDADMQEAFYEAYYSRRFGFVHAELFEGDALSDRLALLKERLTSPTGAFVRRIAPQDPWQLFLEQVETLQEDQQGSLSVRQGQFVVGEAESRAVVLLASKESPFDSDAASRLMRVIDEAFVATSREVGELQLHQAGVHRIAAKSQQTMRADITRVSMAGSVGVMLLLLLLFRSPRVLLLASLPIVGGLVAALGVAQLVFGALHGLTLAFSATLIGVAIDYVAHLLNHHTLDPAPEGAWGSLKRIGPGLAVGAATTVVGLAGLAWTSFPGIREIALVTSIGVAAALLITVWVLPPFLPDQPTPTALHRKLAERGKRFLQLIERQRKILVGLVMLALVLAAVGLPMLQWNDDVRALGSLDPELLAEDQAVREEVARVDSGRFVVAIGATLQAALEVNDQVFVALKNAKNDGLVERFRSLSPMLPAESTQRQRHASIPGDAWARTERALQEQGFVPDLFAPLREALTEPLHPLSPADLEGTPLEELVGSFYFATEGGYAVLSFLHGAEPALEERIDEVPGARFFDQASLMQDAYGSFRARTLEMIGLGLIAVFLLIFLRYRRIRPALTAFAPALIAALVTLGALGLFGVPANLLHVVTLLLVLSMGVDYGVFMVESRSHQSGASATMVSLIIACLSTTLSFGVLALSQSPAMRAMGSVAAAGVLISLVLAPTALLVSGAKADSAAR